MKSLWQIQNELQQKINVLETDVRQIKETVAIPAETIREEAINKVREILEREKPYLPDDVKQRLEKANLLETEEKGVINDANIELNEGDEINE